MSLPRCTQAPEGVAAQVAASLRARLPRLETQRLVLRAPQVEDFAAWAEIFSHSSSKYMGGPLQAEEAWRDFNGYIACWILHGHGAWTVERREDGTVLGFVHLGLEWDDFEPELGWMLLPNARGFGYAKEAVAAARDHATALVGGSGFVSYIDPANAASIRVAEATNGRRDASALRGDADDLVYRYGDTA